MTPGTARATRRQRQALAHRISIGDGNTERLLDVHTRELWQRLADIDDLLEGARLPETQVARILLACQYF